MDARAVNQSREVQIQLPDGAGAPYMRVTMQYEHLGTIMDRKGSHGPAAAHRQKKALRALAPLHKVLSDQKLPFKLRRYIGETMMCSVLLYNMHIWPGGNAAVLQRLSVPYMKMLRIIAGRAGACTDDNVGQRLNNFDIRRLVGAPGLDHVLRSRRLAYLGRLTRSAPPHVFGGVAAAPGWTCVGMDSSCAR